MYIYTHVHTHRLFYLGQLPKNVLWVAIAFQEWDWFPLDKRGQRDQRVKENDASQIRFPNNDNVGTAIINHQFLMVYTNHLWWLGGWFIIAIPTLHELWSPLHFYPHCLAIAPEVHNRWMCRRGADLDWGAFSHNPQGRVQAHALESLVQETHAKPWCLCAPITMIVNCAECLGLPEALPRNPRNCHNHCH